MVHMMRNAIRVLVLVVVVPAAVLSGAGCATGPGGGADTPYRTVQAEPGRDTEAAKRAHRAGLEHLDAGELDKAANAFHRALAEDVEFGPAHNNLGKVYFKREQWHQAAWEFEYARKLMPKSAAPHNNLAMVLERGGDVDQAIEHYEKAVELAPKDIEYHANLARALVRRGDRDGRVRKLLQRVVEEDSRPDWVMWARNQLATMGRPRGPDS